MKPYILIAIIFLGLTLVTCEENNTNQEYQFEAKVLEPNNDCGLFAIQFTKNMLYANDVAGTLYTVDTFIAKNLPSDLQTAGLSILLNMRRIQASELGVCTAIGPSYPWIYVLEARKK